MNGDGLRILERLPQIIERGATEDPRSMSLFLATRGENVEQAVRMAQQELTNRGAVFTTAGSPFGHR